LALAHVYAFSLSTKLLARGRSSPAARWTAAWQMVVAVAVRLLATVPFQLLRESVAFTVSGALLAVLIGATGLEAARTGGASVRRAPLVGTTTLIIGR